MKNILTLVAVVAFCGTVHAQTAQPTTSQNYVTEHSVRVKNLKTKSQVLSAPIGSASVKVGYIDGLGKPLQSIDVQASPEKHDVVTPVTYDAFGREQFKYLPYKPTATTGAYISNPTGTTSYGGAHAAFYSTTTDKVTDDARPFSETVFENSPLSRPVKQYGPGAAWGPASNNKFIEYKYLLNTHGSATNGIEEKIIAWKVVSDLPVREGTVTGFTEANGFYASNQLEVLVTIDEAGKQVRQYTDKLGQVVLKKVQAGSEANLNSASAWALTYYIYDSFGNLRFVFQPELSKALHETTDGVPSTSQLENLAFVYTYDGRKRMITKQVPGAKPVYMVYDNRDRLVLTQDGKQRGASWTFTKYDALDRPVLTGNYESSDTRAQMQTAVDAFYTTNPFFETYSGSNGAVHGYSNVSFPSVSNAAAYYTATYYDQYDSYIAPLGYEFIADNLPNAPQVKFERVKGQVTGTKIKNLVAGTFLRTVNYFDKQYRLIQTVSDHQKGTARTSSVYDFTGQVLHSQRKYTVNSQSTTVKESYAYDHVGRLLVTEHSVNGGAEVAIAGNYYNSLGQLVAKGLHDANFPTIDTEIGQTGVTHAANITRSAYNSSETTLIATNSIVLTNGFHVPANSVFKGRIGFTPPEATQAAAGNFKQMVDYEYNIRGWLTKINNPSAPGTDYFNMELKYNTPTGNGGAAQFNGNISEVVWKTTGMNSQSFGYDYDAMNRLLKGRYFDIGNPVNNGRFNEEIGVDGTRQAYDLNGNIKNLRRYGKTNATQFGLMDDLTYNNNDYAPYGNKLMDVNDAISTNSNEIGFKEDDGVGGDDYAYDDNGNMTKDLNKGVIGITYNYLNLPYQVSKSGTDYITYSYDATGKKLAQQVFGAQAKTTDYIGELVFENNVLQFITHSEGRVVMAGGTDYQYFLKDHLGNVRTTFSTTPTTETALATNEAANVSHENSKFLRINEVKRVTASLFNRTPGSTPGTSIRLNGSANERYGLARSIAVMPGDVINTEVYAKYVDNAQATPTQALIDLLSLINGGAAGVVVDGANLANSTSSFPYGGVLGSSGVNGTAPKVYLNWIVFDKDLLLQPESGFTRITEAARENGAGVSHERLFNPTPITISKPGYVYIYFSNENNTTVDAFFDDFKVEHIKGPLVQVEDYYPFGLIFNTSERQNSIFNSYLYNGKEVQNELALSTYDFGWRHFDPAIARWNVVDPLAEKRVWINPYNYVQNNPINRFDPNGETDFTLNTKTGDVKQVGEADDKPDRIVQTRKDGSIKRKGEGFLGGLVRESKRGEAKTAIGDIQKGILKDGQNFKNQDQIISVGGEGQPSVEGVKSFALKLSEYVGKEIKGFLYSSAASGSATDVLLGKYISNSATDSYGVVTGLQSKYGANFSLNNVLQQFHTHPDGKLGATESAPHRSQDVNALQRDKALAPNASFIILYRVLGQEAPGEYDYTHQYKPKKK